MYPGGGGRAKGALPPPPAQTYHPTFHPPKLSRALVWLVSLFGLYLAPPPPPPKILGTPLMIDQNDSVIYFAISHTRVHRGHDICGPWCVCLILYMNIELICTEPSASPRVLSISALGPVFTISINKNDPEEAGRHDNSALKWSVIYKGPFPHRSLSSPFT